MIKHSDALLVKDPVCLPDELNVEDLVSSMLTLPLMQSAYSCYQSLDGNHLTSEWTGEPAYTTTGTWSGTVDYIMYHSSNTYDTTIELQSVLSIPKMSDLGDGIPNNDYGSDHMSIMATFSIN